MTRRFAEMGGTRRQNLRERVGPNGPAAPPNLAAILGSQLVLDLNADLGVSGIGGSMVWADQSGLHNDVSQSTPAKQPSLNGNALDSHAGLVFAGAQTLAGALSGIAVGDNPKLYQVMSATTSSGSSSCAWECSDVAGTFNRCMSRYSGTGRQYKAEPVAADASPTTWVTGYSLYSMETVTGTTVCKKNDVADGSASAPHLGGLAVAPIHHILGSLEGASLFFFSGTMVRIFIANPAPTAPQHTAIITYLRYTYPSLGL